MTTESCPRASIMSPFSCWRRAEGQVAAVLTPGPGPGLVRGPWVEMPYGSQSPLRDLNSESQPPATRMPGSVSLPLRCPRSAWLSLACRGLSSPPSAERQVRRRKTEGRGDVHGPWSPGGVPAPVTLLPWLDPPLSSLDSSVLRPPGPSCQGLHPGLRPACLVLSERKPMEVEQGGALSRPEAGV